jgi:molecular chaperone Hsp33
MEPPDSKTGDPAPEAPGTLQLGLAGGGALRWAAADVTGVVEDARGRLDLSPVAAAALGRSLAGAALLLRLSTKTPSRLVLEIRGDGPLGRVIAEADPEGNLRGMVGDPRVQVPDLPSGKLAVGSAVGRGMLQVLREHEGGGSYRSQVELVSGEIGEDVAHYLAQSEQRRSAVLLGVLTRSFGVAAAGGFIVEVLPGAPEEVVGRLERNILAVPGVSQLVAAGGSGHVVETLLAGLDRELRETRPLRYRCRCTRDRLLRHLALLSAEERESLADEAGLIEADCVFCGRHYRYEPAELLAN